MSAPNFCNVLNRPMRKQSRRMLVALCASNSKIAVQNLLSDLKRVDAEEIEILLNEIIDAVDEIAEVPPKTASAAKSSTDGSPSARIVHLMRVEAGLPDQEAIAELRTELNKPDRDTPPPAKLSLEEWLQRACIKVPSGEILSAALTISNQRKPRRARNA